MDVELTDSKAICDDLFGVSKVDTNPTLESDSEWGRISIVKGGTVSSPQDVLLYPATSRPQPKAALGRSVIMLESWEGTSALASNNLLRCSVPVFQAQTRTCLNTCDKPNATCQKLSKISDNDLFYLFFM